MELTKDEIKFLKGLKKMKDASDEEVLKIYTLYRKLINKPELVDEYENCNCPSLIRDFHLELLLWTYKNKNLLK